MTKTSTLKTLRRLYPFTKPIMPRLLLGTLSALGAALVPLLIPQVYQVLIDGLLNTPAGEAATRQLWIGVAVVLGLGILEALFLWARRIFVITPATSVEATMRITFFKHLQRIPIAFHDRWASGQLLSRSMGDLGLIRRWMGWGAIMLVVTAITVVIGIGLMFSLSWVLALIFLIAAIPLGVVGFSFHKRYAQVSRLSQEQIGDLTTAVEESIHGIRVLKAYGQAKHAWRSFKVQAEALQDTEMVKARSLARFSMASILLPELALATGLVVGILLVAAGSLSVGSLVAFFATAAVVVAPIGALGPLLSMTLNAKAGLDRYFDVLDAPNTITDPAEPKTLPASRSGNLELQQVSFQFSDATEPVLADVDLKLIPGETLALVGATGSGKTTLLQLIPRLYEVTDGAVTIDGIDVRELRLEELRQHVAIAFEDPVLFSASVRDNVLLGTEFADHTGKTDHAKKEAAEETLQQALEIAQAQFVYELPQGVDTPIGEEGLSLSGGQRQRLALARAIAVKPQILLLDDPLSALDVRTEEAVEERLRAALQDTTTLVVAHRPSTVAMADRVAVLRDGRITAIGTHAELLANDAHYRYILATLTPKTLDVEEFS